ncbi:MAG: DUF2207 domain-containing protein [Dehalococcoidia bacterium]|nr:DUF2207 domain-containing protein [Dehalococcoidia bacterium]
MFPGVILATSGSRFDGFHGLSYLLLVAGCIALVLWLVAFGYRWLRTRPDLPGAGPETSELPNDPEPPAVVSFLVNNWRVTPGAAAATLIDLSARRVLGLDLVGHEDTVVRLRDEPKRDALASYEMQVYRLVASRATGGSAPIEAISLGEEGDAQRWRKRFEKSVIAEARARGLARRRWEMTDYIIIGVGLAFVFGFFALAFGIAHFGENPGEKGSMSPGDWLGAGFASWLAALAFVTRSQAVTDTPLGKQVCARWLGMRDYFRHSHAFDNQPPASVAIWDRLLAYGVATGTARDATRGLPLVAEDPHTAWTRSTGAWREIHISYPERFSWGKRPLFVFAEGLGRTVFWGGIAYVILPVIIVIGWSAASDGLDRAAINSSEMTALMVTIATMIAILGLYLSARTFGGVVRLARGALDLGKTRTLEGEVVKVHMGRFAVDDGNAMSIPALYPLPLGPAVSRGDRVRAIISPHLHHLSRLEVLTRATAPAALEKLGPDPDEPVPTTAGSAIPNLVAPSLAMLTPAALRDATGLALEQGPDPMGHESGAGKPGVVTVRQFIDSSGNKLTVMRAGALPIGGAMFSIATRMMARSGNPVPGLGDSAHWVRERALVVESKGQLLSIDADFPHATPAQRLEAASNVASLILSSPEG